MYFFTGFLLTIIVTFTVLGVCVRLCKSCRGDKNSEHISKRSRVKIYQLVCGGRDPGWLTARRPRWDRGSVELRIKNLSLRCFGTNEDLGQLLSKLKHNIIPLTHYMRLDDLSDKIMNGRGKLNEHDLDDLWNSLNWVINLRAIDEFHSNRGA